MADQTYQRVCRVIGDLAGIDAHGIGPGQCLGYDHQPNFYDTSATGRPLQLDSLDRIQLAMELEEEFGISLSDEEVDNPTLGHVGGLAAFVQGKLDAKPLTSFTYEPEPHISDAAEPFVPFGESLVSSVYRSIDAAHEEIKRITGIPPHGDCA